MGDMLRMVASVQQEKALGQFFDTAASELDLDTIGTPELMTVLNKLCQMMQLNYVNLPAFLLEVNRAAKKYGAKSVKIHVAEAKQREAEMQADDMNEAIEGDGEADEEEKDNYEIDDGEAFSEE